MIYICEPCEADYFDTEKTLKWNLHYSKLRMVMISSVSFCCQPIKVLPTEGYSAILVWHIPLGI